jgi:thiamine-monophosphate kinase
MTPFTAVNEIGEFGLIDQMKSVLDTPSESVLCGIGDDAAVYSIGEGKVQVVTTDALVDGVHFDRMFMPMRYLGYKAISVNASDVLAMNAQPLYATVALALPSNISVEMVKELYQGMAHACKLYGMSLIGGDTTVAKQLMISVTAIGEAKESAISYRSKAQEGDMLCVSGDLGGAYAGLKILLESQKAFKAQDDPEFQPDLTAYDYVIQRQLAPTARYDIFRDWQIKGVVPTACIDISDGLASEIHHICQQSKCGALVKAANIPIEILTREVAEAFNDDPETYALYGGEDYELLFTVTTEDLSKLDPNLFQVIGRILPADEGVFLSLSDGGTMPLEAAGFTHF